MKKVLALVLALMLTLSAFAFASADEESSVVVAVGSQFTTLDPALNTETVNAHAMSHMYATLFKSDEQNVLHNDLCEDYTVSEDGLTYTFTLKQGIKWSDGVEVTAHDIEYGFLRALSFGPTNAWVINDGIGYVKGAAEYNAAALEAGDSFDCTTTDLTVEGFTVLDDYTLQVQLLKPCAYFCRLVSAYEFYPLRPDFAPQHESLWAYEGGYPVCGAYELVECNENENCILKKNPNYYKADTITMENIEFLVMPDGSAQTFAFQTGEIDFALTISTETAISYLDAPELWIMPGASSYSLAINSASTGPEWAKNANVRKALCYAIDKEALVDVLGGAALYPPQYGYVPNGLPGVNKDFREEGDEMNPGIRYDPEMAKTLLAQEGYDESNPLNITYKYSNNGIHADVATMVQAMWNAVGINVEFDCVESGVFYDQIDQGDFEIARYGYSASTDAMSYLELWATPIQVVAAVDDPAYDKMIDDARYIVDPTEYYTTMHEIERYLDTEMCYTFGLFNYTTPALVSQDFAGYESHGGTIWLGYTTVVG